MVALSAFIERRPVAAFWGFAALHLIVWTALPGLLYPNLPSQLVDTLTYVREWPAAFDKLPPLAWTVTPLIRRLFPGELAYFALVQIAVLGAFALVWIMAQRMAGALAELAAVLIIDGLHYFSYTAARFNPDLLQLPCWALAGFAFWSALRRGHLVDWLALGVGLGLALWAKLLALALVLPLMVFLLVDRDARKALTTPGPWLALIVALIVAAPHLAWLAQTDFLTLADASAQAAPRRSIIDHLINPARFAGSQLLFLVPSLVIAAPLLVDSPLWRTLSGQPSSSDVSADADGTRKTSSAFDRRILTWLAFGPVATVLVAAVVSGRGPAAMWGYPLWLFLGIWIVANAMPIDRARLARTVACWSVVFAGFVVAFIINISVLPHFDQRYRRVLLPGDRIAAELTERFRSATGEPLAYVIAGTLVGGNVAYYAPEHPRVLIEGDPQRAPRIDLADLRRRGAIVAWIEGPLNALPPALARAAEGAQIQPPFQLPFRRGRRVATIGWAILPPAR